MRATAIRRTLPSLHQISIAFGAAAISIALITLWSKASYADEPMTPAAKGTRVKPDTPTRVFVMAGFTPDACAFKGFPDMQLDAQPAKGQVSFK
ncbi:MAG: hypothetical protein ABL893_09235 [Hyphomicrobium sp.]|nr:hypothetical protein [Hyphomicrobium sp.]